MLIDNWKTSWKLWSVLASVALGLFNAAVAADFWGLLGTLGPGGAAAITSVVTIVVIPLLRMLKQQADEAVPPDQVQKQGGFVRPSLLVVTAVTALLVACASMPAPKTFEDNVAATVVSVTQTRKAAELLLVAGKITRADAENVQKQADNAREAVAVAMAIRTTDPGAAQNKLTAAVTVLRALDTYLAQKGSKP